MKLWNGIVDGSVAHIQDKHWKVEGRGGQWGDAGVQTPFNKHVLYWIFVKIATHDEIESAHRIDTRIIKIINLLLLLLHCYRYRNKIMFVFFIGLAMWYGLWKVCITFYQFNTWFDYDGDRKSISDVLVLITLLCANFILYETYKQRLQRYSIPNLLIPFESNMAKIQETKRWNFSVYF